jgi:hypothetical protein
MDRKTWTDPAFWLFWIVVVAMLVWGTYEYRQLRRAVERSGESRQGEP